MSETVTFEGDTYEVEVRLEGETLWLTQKQMGKLFSTTPENVLMHLKNIFKDNELDEAAIAKDFLVVRQEGKWLTQTIELLGKTLIRQEFVMDLDREVDAAVLEKEVDVPNSEEVST